MLTPVEHPTDLSAQLEKCHAAHVACVWRDVSAPKKWNSSRCPSLGWDSIELSRDQVAYAESISGV